MKKKKSIIFASILVIAIISCLAYFGTGWFFRNETKEIQQISKNSLYESKNLKVPTDPQKNFQSEAPKITFLQTGNTAQEFVPEAYEIVLDAKGMLNHDDLEDVVLILQDKIDSTSLRPVLVLFKQPSGGYKLGNSSWKAIGAAYINGQFKQYDDESVNIDGGAVKISISGSGPTGSRETWYRFINNQLVLTKMQTFNMGAGGQTTMDIDLLKGSANLEQVNTLEENATPQIKVARLPRQLVYPFETTDPQLLSKEIYKRF